jgi:hypothetical protein
MRALVLVVLFSSLASWAQAPEDEFSMPVFAAPDAGAPEASPPTPPLLPAPEADVPPEPQPALVFPATPVVLKEPRWSRATLSAVGLISGLLDLYVGVEVSLAAVFSLTGPPIVTDEKTRQVEGWLVTVGGDFLGGRVSGRLCAGSDFCGQRWAGGATARIGHATAYAARDGSVGLKRFWFGGLSAQAAYVSVPPAPLVAGSQWVEGVLRLKAGLEASTTPALTRAARAAIIQVQVFVFGEYIAFAPVPRGFQLGAAVGVSF